MGYPGSVICTDPKGENHAITTRAQRRFGPVYCINVGDAPHMRCRRVRYFEGGECLRGCGISGGMVEECPSR